MYINILQCIMNMFHNMSYINIHYTIQYDIKYSINLQPYVKNAIDNFNLTAIRNTL